jgi:hypothetical protein
MVTFFRNRQILSRATFPDLRRALGANSARADTKKVFARTTFRDVRAEH